MLLTDEPKKEALKIFTNLISELRNREESKERNMVGLV